MKRLTIIAASLPLIACALSSRAAAAEAATTEEEAPMGWSMAEIQQALTGMRINGGPLQLEMDATDKGDPYLITQVPNTDVLIVVHGFGCDPPPGACQGLGLFYIGNQSTDAYYINDFNSSFAYTKIYRRDEENGKYLVVTGNTLTVGLVGAEALQFRYHVFAEDLFKFFETVSAATAAGDGAHVDLAKGGGVAGETGAARLSPDLPRYILIGGGEVADEVIRAVVEEQSRALRK
jgi:hypothetical protein